MEEYKRLETLVQKIYKNLSNDIQGNKETTINKIANALLTGDTTILDYMEEEGDLYNDTITFILFDRKRVVDKLIKRR